MVKKPNVSSVDNQVNTLWLKDEKIDLVPEVRITIKDFQNIPIKSFSELNKDRAKNNVEIFVDFFVKGAKTRIEDDELVAQYKLKARGSKEEYLRNRKEALTKHICENLLNNADDSYKVNKDLINNEKSAELKCEIVKISVDNGDGTTKDDIVIKINKESNLANKGVEVSRENITLIPNFNLPRRIDEVINFSSPPKTPDPFWTWGKIISACVVIGIIAALIFFYRKKIWSWIKREDETKKRSKSKYSNILKNIEKEF